MTPVLMFILLFLVISIRKMFTKGGIAWLFSFAGWATAFVLWLQLSKYFQK